jgi:hypothetical protein
MTLSTKLVQTVSAKSSTTVTQNFSKVSLDSLRETPYTLYGDEPLDVLTILRARFLLWFSRGGMFNVMDNLLREIKKDHRRLVLPKQTMKTVVGTLSKQMEASQGMVSWM